MFGTLLIIIITYMKADILKPSRQTILREAKDYVMIAVGMILYGIGRFLIEFLRNDYRGEVGFLSTSQFISIFFVICGVGLLVFNKLHSKQAEAK